MLYDLLSDTRINFWCRWFKISRLPKLSNEIVTCLFPWFHISSSLFIRNKSVGTQNGPELKGNMHLWPLNHQDATKFGILHCIFLHSNHSVALHKPNRVRKSMWSVSLKLPCSLKTLWILASVCVCLWAHVHMYACACMYMCVWPIMSSWRGHLAVDSQSLPGAAV